MSPVITGVGLAVPGARVPADLLTPPRGAVDPIDPATLLDPRGLRYLDRATQLALCAADPLFAEPDGPLAAPHARRPSARERTAVVVSTNYGNLDTVCHAAATISTASTDALRPMALPNASSNNVASALAIRFGLQGANVTLCNGPTSGLDAVFWAAGMIATGRCDRCLVIGVETTNEVVQRLLDAPAEALFDGAVALVVDDAAGAAAGGTPPLARIVRSWRDGDVAASVKRVLDGEAAPPGVWFTPEDPAAAHVGLLPDVARVDLTRTRGRASGALGVLQCAAAIGWFTGQADALATVGDDHGDGVTTLLLRPVPGGTP